MKAWFVNAQIDRAQICSMTHAETKLLQSLDKQGRANTDLFSSRWGRVGCGVCCMCTNICPATWTWQHNGMRDMRKKNSGCGVFFCVWTDICLGPWTWQQNGMGDTYEGKKKFWKNFVFLQKPFWFPSNSTCWFPSKQTKVFLQWKSNDFPPKVNCSFDQCYSTQLLCCEETHSPASFFLLKLLSFWQTANFWGFCKSTEIQTVGKVKCFRKCASWWERK